MAPSERPEANARYRALHGAVLRIAAAAPAGPDTIDALLKQIADGAVEALAERGARDARMVLVEHPAWGDLVPGKSPDDGQVILGVNGRLERWPILPSFPAYLVLATGEPVYVPEIEREYRFNPLSTRFKRGIRSFAVVPLRAGGRILGTLAVDFVRPGDMDDADRKVLELFAAHAAAALERAQLIYGELERARQDEAERHALAAAEAALRARDEFFSIAAHELRTPLTALAGYVQLLRRQLRRDAPDVAAAQAAAAVADQQAHKMNRLISQLLDVSRLERGRLALDWSLADLAELVEEVVRATRLAAERCTLTVRTPGQPVLVRLDPLRFEQVLVNLLDNAVKYSPDGGGVEVTLEASRAQGLWLTVEDHGIGIPPEHRERIFERYYRASGLEQAGAGLGLFICREIVELHGGQIGAEFPESGGTRMVVTLPASLVQDPQAKSIVEWLQPKPRNTRKQEEK